MLRAHVQRYSVYSAHWERLITNPHREGSTSQLDQKEVLDRWRNPAGSSKRWATGAVGHNLMLSILIESVGPV